MKAIKIVFIVLFVGMLALPFVFANRGGAAVSEEENRTLNQRPSFIKDGSLNVAFTYDYEDWFLDNLGFRSQLTDLYAKMQYYVFNNIFDTDMYMGRNGDTIYATDEMITDYQHLNLRTEEEVSRIGESYQVVSDWLKAQDIQFYYVQCYDKHSIYPERFMEHVNQDGQVSKTDQVIFELTNDTSVNVISLKDTLLDNKEKYDVFSHHGDPSHWSYRGAFLCYQHIMQEINAQNDNQFKVLQEGDYSISICDQGKYLKGDIHFEDYQEAFALKNPIAEKTDAAVLQQFSNDVRHSAWVNQNAGNDTKVLIVGDSYVDSYILDSLAESFSRTYMIWGDYTSQMTDMIEVCQPDIVIYECAERVDRSRAICELAERLNEGL